VSASICGINYFDMLGVKPLRGRTFLPEDDTKGIGNTVVIGESLWRRTFGADPNILGQKLTAGGAQVTIIGIIPSSFSVFPWKSDVDMWYAINPFGMPKIRWIWKMGRLKPGVTIPQAQAELNAIARAMPEHSDADADWSVAPATEQRIRARHPALFLYAARRRGFRPLDRLRQRGQPFAGARSGSSKGNCHSCLSGRREMALGSSVVDREFIAEPRGRRPGCTRRPGRHAGACGTGPLRCDPYFSADR